MYCTGLYQSPIGRLVVKSSSLGITEIQFDDNATITVSTNDHVDDCLSQLSEYFDGHRKDFNFSLDPEGTDFQKSVWKHLVNIPYGTTVSYKYIADLLSNPGAIRAVGAANGRNKIPIVIPCHRVIGSDGSLTGYASGLERKEWLLKHEGHPRYNVSQLNMFK